MIADKIVIKCKECKKDFDYKEKKERQSLLKNGVCIKCLKQDKKEEKKCQI